MYNFHSPSMIDAKKVLLGSGCVKRHFLRSTLVWAPNVATIVSTAAATSFRLIASCLHTHHTHSQLREGENGGIGVIVVPDKWDELRSPSAS